MNPTKLTFSHETNFEEHNKTRHEVNSEQMLNPTKRTYQVENNLEKHNDLRITHSWKRICTPRSLQEELLNENQVEII